jgi:hypothetical protein
VRVECRARLGSAKCFVIKRKYVVAQRRYDDFIADWHAGWN